MVLKEAYFAVAEELDSVTSTRLLRRRIGAARPMARGIYFTIMPALFTVMFSTRSFASSSPCCFAFAAALWMSLAIGSDARFGRNESTARASLMDLPFTISVTRRTLRGDWL